jgi:sugar O-acyltransferase (sialic acid O-acetyltransferase NeuD family)
VVIGKVSDVQKHLEDSDFFVAIGNNQMREKIQSSLSEINASIVTLIHPNATIAIDVQIGIGTAIMAGAVINSSTIIGNGCIINTSSSIDHDNIIEDFVHISPGARLAGSVKVGNRTWIGIGGTLSNNVTIYSDCILGAGIVLVKDIIESGTYVGLPIRRVD